MAPIKSLTLARRALRRCSYLADSNVCWLALNVVTADSFCLVTETWQNIHSSHFMAFTELRRLEGDAIGTLEVYLYVEGPWSTALSGWSSLLILPLCVKSE